MENKSPIFVIGCRRSGASLLRYILDSHDDIAAPPESKFLRGLYEFVQAPETIDGLSGLGMSKDDIVHELGRMSTAILEGYAKRRGKRRWADKTPSYHRILDFIDDVFQGSAQFLFMIRHPLDNIESLYENAPYSPATPLDDDLVQAIRSFGGGRYGYAKFWNDVNERILLFAASRSSRSLLVRYEDLVQSPQTTAARVFEFLGESCPSGVAERAFEVSHDPSAHDRDIQATSRIHADRIGRWNGWSSAEIGSLWLIVGPVAERLGYPNPGRPFPTSWAP
jgi:hypothetical protein